MKHAEDVIFGGGGLERAAHLREDAAALTRAWANARVVLLWQGKPLVISQDQEVQGLAYLASAHPLVAALEPFAVFLGHGSDGTPIFAAALTGWSPTDADANQLNQFLDASEQRHPDLPASHVFAELRRIMTMLSPLEAEIAATGKAVLAWHRSHRFCASCGAASAAAKGGWQRNCPACATPHFPRTDPVVIMLITEGDSVLLGRSPGWPKGMYSLLAGFVEPGETLEAAVRREVMEETAVPVGEIGYLASQPWAFPMSLMIGCRGRALGRDITIDPTEIEDACWVTRQELMEAFAGTHPQINPARKGSIAHFLLFNWLADKLD